MWKITLQSYTSQFWWYWLCEVLFKIQNKYYSGSRVRIYWTALRHSSYLENFAHDLIDCKTLLCPRPVPRCHLEHSHVVPLLLPLTNCSVCGVFLFFKIITSQDNKGGHSDSIATSAYAQSCSYCRLCGPCETNGFCHSQAVLGLYLLCQEAVLSPGTRCLQVLWRLGGIWMNLQLLVSGQKIYIYIFWLIANFTTYHKICNYNLFYLIQYMFTWTQCMCLCVIEHTYNICMLNMGIHIQFLVAFRDHHISV